MFSVAFRRSWSACALAPTATAMSATARSPPAHPRGRLTGSERTTAQDVGYGLRQLTDVVVRALSPGINDPTTAVHGLVACTAVVVELLPACLGAVYGMRLR